MKDKRRKSVIKKQIQQHDNVSAGEAGRVQRFDGTCWGNAHRGGMMSEAAPACCCRLQDVDSLCSGCGLSLFDVDGRHISRLEVSTLLWHLLWYVTQPSSQNRRPGHMWWCLVQFTLITRSLRLTPPPPLLVAARHHRNSCSMFNA